MVIAWLVTRAAARAVVLPYDVAGPYVDLQIGWH